MPINIADLLAKAHRPASVVLSEHADEILQLMQAGISHKQILEILHQEYGIQIKLPYFRELIRGWSKGAKPRNLRSLEKYGDSLQQISTKTTRTPSPKNEPRPLLRRQVAPVTRPEAAEPESQVAFINLKPTPAPQTTEQATSLFNRALQTRDQGMEKRKLLPKATGR